MQRLHQEIYALRERMKTNDARHVAELLNKDEEIQALNADNMRLQREVAMLDRLLGVRQTDTTDVAIELSSLCE